MYSMYNYTDSKIDFDQCEKRKCKKKNPLDMTINERKQSMDRCLINLLLLCDTCLNQYICELYTKPSIYFVLSYLPEIMKV